MTKKRKRPKGATLFYDLARDAKTVPMGEYFNMRPYNPETEPNTGTAVPTDQATLDAWAQHNIDFFDEVCRLRLLEMG